MRKERNIRSGDVIQERNRCNSQSNCERRQGNNCSLPIVGRLSNQEDCGKTLRWNLENTWFVYMNGEISISLGEFRCISERYIEHWATGNTVSNIHSWISTKFYPWIYSYSKWISLWILSIQQAMPNCGLMKKMWQKWKSEGCRPLYLNMQRISGKIQILRNSTRNNNSWMRLEERCFSTIWKDWYRMM